MFPDFLPKTGNRLLYGAVVINFVFFEGVYNAMSQVAAATANGFPENEIKVQKKVEYHSPLMLLQDIILGKDELLQNNWSSRGLLEGHSEERITHDLPNIDPLYENNVYLMDNIQSISELLHYTFSKNPPKTSIEENNVNQILDPLPEAANLTQTLDTEIKNAIFNHIEPELQEVEPLDEYEVEALNTSLAEVPSEAYYNKILRMALRKGKKKRFGILLHYWGAINDTTLENFPNNKSSISPSIVTYPEEPSDIVRSHPEPQLLQTEYDGSTIPDKIEKPVSSSIYQDTEKSSIDKQDIPTNKYNVPLQTQGGCRGGYCMTQYPTRIPEYGMQERKLAFRDSGTLLDRLVNTRHKEENRRDVGSRRQKRERRDIFSEEDPSDLLAVYEALKHAVQNGVEAIMSGSAEVDPKTKSKRRDRRAKNSTEGETDNEGNDTPRMRRKKNHASNTAA